MKPTFDKVANTIVVATLVSISLGASARTDEEQDVKLNEHRLYIDQNWNRSIANEDKISTLNTGFNNLQSNIQTMDTKIESMDNQLQALDAADIQGIDTRMSDFETSDANQDTRITKNSDTINSLETRVTNNYDAVNNQGTKITENTDAIDSQDDRITTNRGDIINIDNRISTTQKQVADFSGRVDRAETIANSAKATANTAEATANTARTVADTAWKLAQDNNSYIVDNRDRSIENKTALAETDDLLATTTKTANWANYTAEINYKNVISLYGWAEEVTDDYNAMNAYIGVIPEDPESDSPATLYKHAAQENIHLGSGAQVGDNLNPEDEGYDEALIKTGMTAVGSNSRADADTSTALGARSKTYGENSVAIGYQSIANDDNTVSFGNDYQAAVEAVEYQAEVLAVEAVEASEGVEAVEGVEYQPEILAVEGKAEILANTRRLTHISAGVNPNDAVNMEQHNSLSSYAGELHNYISVVDSQGVKNRKNLAVTDKELSAINTYLGVLPDDGLSDSREMLIQHAIEESIHLGVGAQVGDNYPDSVNLKTGMTSLGAYSRADGDKSTALGANSKANGANSVAIGANSVSSDDNTVSFGNDYQAATEAQAAHDGNVAVPARAEILANNRRLTHVAAGINANDAVNMEQHLNLSDRVTNNRSEARSGISMAMAMDVIAPSPGKNFRLNLAMADFEGTSAIGITGAGRVNDSVSLFFGYGVDVDNDYSALKVGTSYEW